MRLKKIAELYVLQDFLIDPLYKIFLELLTDYYLQTPACDLRSLLALRLKRQILVALADKTLYPNDPEKRTEVYDKYKQYLSAVRNFFIFTYTHVIKNYTRYI